MTKPLTPPDCDLRDFGYMPLEVVRLRDSDIAVLASAEGFRAAVLLWCACWHQVPAASLPDDDRMLARLAGFGRDMDAWQEVREEALRSFVKCSDGRLYHPVIAGKAVEAWEAKLKHRKRAIAGANARWGQRTENNEENANSTNNGDADGNASSMPQALPQGCQGKGEVREGIGKEIQHLATLDVVTAAPAAPPAPKPPPKAKRQKPPAGVYTEIPPDAEITAKQLVIARKLGLTDEEADFEFNRFRDSARANHRTYVDWDAAYRSWLTSPYGILAARAKAKLAKPQTNTSFLLNINGDFYDESDSSVPFERSSAAYVAGFGEGGEGISLAPSAGRIVDLLAAKPVGSG